MYEAGIGESARGIRRVSPIHADSPSIPDVSGRADGGISCPSLPNDRFDEMDETKKTDSSAAESAGIRRRPATSIGCEGEIQIRVRYQETDQMGVVYHGNYFTYFEMGRTELLREATGVSYKDVENQDVMMVVAEVQCRYLKPALYDDLLTLKTRVAKVTGASVEHTHELYRGDELLATGRIKLVCVSKKDGKIVPVPAYVRDFPNAKPAADADA